MRLQDQKQEELLRQGGVSVNGEKVSAIDAVFPMELFEDGVVVKKGKKNFRKVTV